MTGINSRTIHKCLKRMRERRNIENLPRSGGRRKTTPRDDRILKDVTAIFNQRTGCNGSPKTACRRLFWEGYKRTVVSKKITNFQVSRQRRVEFGLWKLHWTVDQWSHIIFSDDTKIILGQNRKFCVWRKAGERLRPECVGRRNDWKTTRCAPVMCWGAYHIMAWEH